jgi:hypothetical protein
LKKWLKVQVLHLNYLSAREKRENLTNLEINTIEKRETTEVRVDKFKIFMSSLNFLFEIYKK